MWVLISLTSQVVAKSPPELCRMSPAPSLGGFSILSRSSPVIIWPSTHSVAKTSTIFSPISGA